MFNFWVDFFSEAVAMEISESLRFPVSHHWHVSRLLCYIMC